MERTMKCLRFELSRTMRIMAVFIAFYAFFYLAFLALSLGQGRAGEQFSYYFFNAAVFFVFAGLAFPYGGISNSLLLFGNTRRAVFAAGVLDAASLSASLAVLSLLSDFFNPWLAGLLHFRTFQFLPLLYKGSPESGAGVPVWLLFYFSAFLAVSGAALFYGALRYRFGKRFTIVFWAGFGLLCGVLPGFLATVFKSQFLWAVKAYFAAGVRDSIALASLHLLLTALVFGALAWLIARRQEQYGAES